MILAGWLMMSGCGEQPPREAVRREVSVGIQTISDCPHEAGRAVLNKLTPEFSGYEKMTEASQVDAYEYKIECVREWAKELKDTCLRGNYLEWLDYFAGKAAETRRQILAGIPVSDEYENRRRREDKALRDYTATHVVPAPPLCERTLIERVR